MYLCSLLDESSSVICRESRTFKQIVNIPESTEEGYINVVDDNLAFVPGEGYGIFSISPQTEEDLDKENGLIWVLSKDIIFYEGVKAYIKFINVNKNVVLSCLVSGTCGYTSPSGEVVQLTRGSVDVPTPSAKQKVFTGETLKSIVMNVDKETGYDMRNDIVNAVVVSISKSTKLETSASYKKVKEGIVIFDSTGLHAAKKRVEDRKKKEEEKQRILAQKQAEARAKAEEAKKQEVEKQFQAASMGAKSFLDQLQAMKTKRG